MGCQASSWKVCHPRLGGSRGKEARCDCWQQRQDRWVQVVHARTMLVAWPDCQAWCSRTGKSTLRDEGNACYEGRRGRQRSEDWHGRRKEASPEKQSSSARQGSAGKR